MFSTGAKGHRKVQVSQFGFQLLTMFFNDIRLLHRISRQWQACSVSEGYFFKHVLPSLWPSDKPSPAKFTSYRNFSILEKVDVDLAFDDELTAVPTINQEITIVAS